MVHMWSEKNSAISLQQPLSYKKMVTTNRTGYNVKLDVFVTGDMLVVEILDVNDDPKDSEL